MDHLSDLNNRLRVIAGLLDGTASQIRDIPLEPTGTHIRAIGEALVTVFEIQGEIYRVRPDLEPPHQESPVETQEANRRLSRALSLAYDLADKAKCAEAIAVLSDFAKSETSEHHRSIAEWEIGPIKRRCA